MSISMVSRISFEDPPSHVAGQCRLYRSHVLWDTAWCRVIEHDYSTT